MNFDAKAGYWDNDPQKITRAETVAARIRELVPLRPDTKTLEYGCGTGLLGFALQPDVGPLVLADSSQGMIAVVEEKIAAGGFEAVTSLLLDLSHDHAPVEKFDLICTLMTLHHVVDYQGLLEKFHQMLGSGGFLCIADLDAEDGSFHGGDFDGHSGFVRDDLSAVLKKVGFEDIRFSTVFEVVHNKGDHVRRYPVFLMVCRRSC